MAMNIEISTLVYQEGEAWIAQGLEYDVTAQADSLHDLRDRFAMKVAAEISISLDLGREPLQGIAPAPEFFWRMFKEAQMTISAEPSPVRIADGAAHAHRILPWMKLGAPTRQAVAA